MEILAHVQLVYQSQTKGPRETTCPSVFYLSCSTKLPITDTYLLSTQAISIIEILVYVIFLWECADIG